ncbi:MAG: ribonuclease P protein component [Bacteroidota bacterium]|nr:ribonuclease P protein component [Bacteroidota bacterium]
MASFRFHKSERLCSKIKIQSIFSKTQGVTTHLHFPILFLCLPTTFSESVTTQVMISVSKRKFKHAKDRNRIKRIMREAWRLNNSELKTKLLEHHIQLAIVMVYMPDFLPDFAQIQNSVIGFVVKYKLPK